MNRCSVLTHAYRVDTDRNASLVKLTIILAALAIPVQAIQDPVRVNEGLLSGASGKNAAVRVYKGIPYAAPPTENLRWKAPKPPASWEGTRQAVEFSPACLQTPYPKGSIYFSEPEKSSEDCLYLNIWTAARSANEKRPVMVWIHGGALTRGSGSIPVYNGEALAAKGVVLVTLNYRLGLFGFLAHPGLTKESDRKASGNYAFLDQIAALQWVQKNIGVFGGDPSRVTIFGESAGSWSVNYLVATPLAKGLFQRAIGESGGTFGPMKTLAEAEQIGSKFAANRGAESVDALRQKPADELLRYSALGTFPANVDGWLLPHDVTSIFTAGRQNDVPTLIGSNADEATSLAPWPADGTAATFIAQIRQRFGAQSDEALKIYPADSDEQARASHYASFRDLVFGWQMRTWARQQTRTGKSKVYLYYFSHVPPGPASKRLGAYHASEIAYVFNNLDGTKPWVDKDRELADTISSYWVNFANTGDPNGKGVPRWVPYQATMDTALELGDTIQPVSGLHKDALELLDRYFGQIGAASR